MIQGKNNPVYSSRNIQYIEFYNKLHLTKKGGIRDADQVFSKTIIPTEHCQRATVISIQMNNA